MSMQIRQKSAPFAIIRMGNRVTRFGAFARDLADSRHGVNLWTNLAEQPRFIPGCRNQGNHVRTADKGRCRGNVEAAGSYASRGWIVARRGRTAAKPLD